ncbi:uncharacterized protein B0H18DRAFT_156630 [Fomitopsis serialis]|uniref:uncharacterized protein n=1 Tax=Fomitopsis serialis TaxID=139415 RepID=UPI002007292C|nr:uncharacterized protein B0H18DRAFT_156630 [Neoantrodia serialis]KAH9913877.1 hypothetical protein B0H18DRAFT_156630 [Neoantrodia serialis]
MRHMTGSPSCPHGRCVGGMYYIVRRNCGSPFAARMRMHVYYASLASRALPPVPMQSTRRPASVRLHEPWVRPSSAIGTERPAERSLGFEPSHCRSTTDSNYSPPPLNARDQSEHHDNTVRMTSRCRIVRAPGRSSQCAAARERHSEYS